MFLPGNDRIADMTKFKAEEPSSWFQHTIGLLKCLRQSRRGKLVSVEQHPPILIPYDGNLVVNWEEERESWPAIFNIYLWRSIPRQVQNQTTEPNHKYSCCYINRFTPDFVSKLWRQVGNFFSLFPSSQLMNVCQQSPCNYRPNPKGRGWLSYKKVKMRREHDRCFFLFKEKILLNCEAHPKDQRRNDTEFCMSNVWEQGGRTGKNIFGYSENSMLNPK